MKKRHMSAILAIAALALSILIILTALPLAGTAAPRLERQPLESLTALNSTDLEAEAAATERGAPLSVFSALSGISDSLIRTLRVLRLAFCIHLRQAPIGSGDPACLVASVNCICIFWLVDVY
jgi:hypothetical protein